MTYKTLQFWHTGITITVRQAYCLRSAKVHSQRVLKLQHSLDITTEVKGISLRSVNPRATQRLQVVFTALELLKGRWAVHEEWIFSLFRFAGGLSGMAKHVPI